MREVKAPRVEVSCIWPERVSIPTSTRCGPVKEGILHPKSHTEPLEEQADDINRFRGSALIDIAERRGAQPLLGTCSLLSALGKPKLETLQALNPSRDHHAMRDQTVRFTQC